MARACNKLDEGKSHYDKYHYPESISACQECIELAMKAIFHFAEIKFPPKHTFIEENFRRVLEKIGSCSKRQGLERLYMLSEFWSSMYNVAKYGCEKIGAEPEKLFSRGEAFFALHHAFEVYEQARHIYYDCAPQYYGKSSIVKTAPNPSFSRELKL